MPDPTPDPTPDQTQPAQPAEPAESSESAAATTEGGTAGSAPAARAPSPARRFARAFFSLSRSQFVIAVALFALGIAGAVQVRSVHATAPYASASRDDLVNILDGLGQANSRLQVEISGLQAKRSQLTSAADRAKVARQQADEQIRSLSVLAGTVPVRGPGVRITLSDPQGKLTAAHILDAVQEMRDAGAEAIAINGRVRVVATTSFADVDGGISVDGTTLRAPYVLSIIGDPSSLSAAAKFPGGLVEQITGPQVGGDAQVRAVDIVEITALHKPGEPRYARTAKPR